MRIEKSQFDGVTVFHFEGRLESVTYDTFESLILDDPQVRSGTGVVLDFKNLKYVSSSGIRSIFEIRFKLASRNQRLVITQASTNVIQVFNLLGVWTSFTYVAELEPAISSAKGS